MVKEKTVRKNMSFIGGRLTGAYKNTLSHMDIKRMFRKGNKDYKILFLPKIPYIKTNLMSCLKRFFCFNFYNISNKHLQHFHAMFVESMTLNYLRF